jgi:hypothetical protein
LTYHQATKVESTAIRCFFISWDWSEQPDFGDLEATVNWLLTHGATHIYFALADDGSDSHSVVISDSQLSKTQASRALEDRNDAIASGNPPPASGLFVWHRSQLVGQRQARRAG